MNQCGLNSDANTRKQNPPLLRKTSSSIKPLDKMVREIH